MVEDYDNAFMDELIEKIKQGVAHAREKHPDFVDSFDEMFFVLNEELKEIKEARKEVEEAKTFNDICIAETHVDNEIIDAIAVLCRWYLCDETDEVREVRKIEAKTSKSEERTNILKEAGDVIGHKRMNEYGEPENTFDEIAMLWNWWLNTDKIKPSDVAKMLALMKDAREHGGKGKRDNSVDRIGYEALYAGLKGY